MGKLRKKVILFILCLFSIHVYGQSPQASDRRQNRLNQFQELKSEAQTGGREKAMTMRNHYRAKKNRQLIMELADISSFGEPDFVAHEVSFLLTDRMDSSDKNMSKQFCRLL